MKFLTLMIAVVVLGICTGCVSSHIPGRRIALAETTKIPDLFQGAGELKCYVNPPTGGRSCKDPIHVDVIFVENSDKRTRGCVAVMEYNQLTVHSKGATESITLTFEFRHVVHVPASGKVPPHTGGFLTFDDMKLYDGDMGSKVQDIFVQRKGSKLELDFNPRAKQLEKFQHLPVVVYEHSSGKINCEGVDPIVINDGS